MMFWHYHDMGWWGYAGMAVAIIVFCVPVVVGVVALIRFAIVDRTPRRSPTNDAPPSEQVLAARFAGGEIDEAEYRERLAVVRNHVNQ